VYRDNLQSYLQKIEADFAACSLIPVEGLRFFVNHLQSGLESATQFRKNIAVDLLLVYNTFPVDVVYLTKDDKLLAGFSAASLQSHELSL
jgi:hypothetical protein